MADFNGYLCIMPFTLSLTDSHRKGLYELEVQWKIEIWSGVFGAASLYGRKIKKINST